MVVGFSRDGLQSFADTTVPDLIGPGVRLLFVGINPGLWSAAAAMHFARPGNRFYPALLEAGIIERPVGRDPAMAAADSEYLIERRVGITNVVERATAKASELDADELRAGGERLRETVRRLAPTVVAIAGITAYRTAFAQPKATTGEQADGFEGARLFVVPNPSGLNAHETISSLAVAYRGAAVAAGIV